MQDGFLEILNESDNEADKQFAIMNLRLIHNSTDNGDIDEEIKSLNEKIDYMKLELFRLKNEY
jgi:cell division protein FtsL